MRRLLPVLALALLAGCAPKPDASIVLWEQPSPQIAAEAHAREISGRALWVQPTGSMEPMISGGDWIVVDYRLSFDTIRPGKIINYQAGWLPFPNPTVTHMAAAKSGDAWIMSGIANKHYEGGAQAMTREQYRGTVVQVYTRRAKS